MNGLLLIMMSMLIAALLVILCGLYIPAFWKEPTEEQSLRWLLRMVIIALALNVVACVWLLRHTS